MRKAISLNPNNTVAYYNLGVTLHQQGNLEGEITAWQKSISLNPNDAEAHYNLALALSKQSNEVEAIVELKKARDLYRSQGNTQADKLTQLLEKIGSR